MISIKNQNINEHILCIQITKYNMNNIGKELNILN